MITRIVQLTFQEHLVDDFLDIFKESGPQIRAFDGCLNLELVRDIYRPHVFFTISRWADEAVLENYRNSDLFRNTWETTRTLFSVPAHAWSTSDTGQ